MEFLSSSRYGLVLIAALFVTIGCASHSYSSGSNNQHVQETIAHAEEAVTHGKAGHSKELVTHAEVALTHGQAAMKEVKNPHLDAGVKELEEAIAHGKQDHAEVATEHAISAVEHLKEVK